VAEPSLKSIKKLFSLSGNLCAFPSCNLPIVESSGTITGEICHIRARSKNGPRYDENQTDEERHGFENLILLCRHHHKMIDSEPEIYDVESLIEIKGIHERLVGRKEQDQDSFYARILINGSRKINIKGNEGTIIIDSPGAVHGNTVNISAKQEKIVVAPPPETIGSKGDESRYIRYLIKRYNKFAVSHDTRKTKFNYGAVSKNISDKYGADWKLLPLDMFPEISRYLQNRIMKTKLANVNLGKGYSSFSTYEEYLEKYGEKTHNKSN